MLLDTKGMGGFPQKVAQQQTQSNHASMIVVTETKLHRYSI